MENKKYFSVDDIDTSKDKGIYKRDSIYYRDSFQSGVCSALHYLAKQPAADVVSREQYDTLLNEAKEIDRNAAATQKEYMQQVKELVGLLVDTAPAMNTDYIKGEIERITGKSMDVANKWAIESKMPALVEQFKAEYNALYNETSDKQSEYYKYLDAGDRILENKTDVVKAFAELRGDFLSSDREIAAFAIAYEKVFGEEATKTNKPKPKATERD